MRTIPDSADNVTTKTNLLTSTYENTGLGILFFVSFCFVLFFFDYWLRKATHLATVWTTQIINEISSQYKNQFLPM